MKEDEGRGFQHTERESKTSWQVPKDFGGPTRSLKVPDVGAAPAALVVTTRGCASSVSVALWAPGDQRAGVPTPDCPQQPKAFGGGDFYL